MDAMTEQEVRHHTRPLSREQCYLCIMTLVDPPPKGSVPEERLKAEHKKFLVELETKGMLFGAGKLANEKRGEKTALGHGMFILRAESQAEAEKIAHEEPFTKHGYRTMVVHPWQRTEGDISLRINFQEGMLTIDRRRYTLNPA
jgi:uncharacterized protein YciI